MRSPTDVLSDEHRVILGALTTLEGRSPSCSRSTSRTALIRDGGGGPARAAAAREYVSLLRDHIAKEDGVVFPLADSVLDPVAAATVVEGLAPPLG